MAKKLIGMRQVIEILRLKHEHQLSVREIALSCGVAPSTVGDYLQRAQQAQLSWSRAVELTEPELHQRLFGASPSAPQAAARVAPDWAHIHAELRRPNVTLRLLWQEYHAADPTAFSYTRFCELYAAWRRTLEPTLRQVHVPGEKLFVDWAGQTMPITDPTTGTISQAALFVAVLGASNKLFAAAFPDQRLASWISAHVQAYAYFGGVPRVTVPDNPKTGVTRACRYEPLLQRTYQELATHYGTVILPARPRRPRDKAKVESGVQVAQRQLLAPLRDLVFFAVAELNAALQPRLAELNAQPFQKLAGSRDELFRQLDQPQLQPLPATPFELAEFFEVTVNIDYHVVVDRHGYSVPYQLIHQRLVARLTATTVELFQAGKRLAAHARSHQRGGFTTLPEHRPKAHERHLSWTPSRLIEWAGKIGPQCGAAVTRILQDRPHPEQGYRSCLGLMRLARGVGPERMEAACRRALHFGTVSYRSLDSILHHRLDQQPYEVDLPFPTPLHENVRGGDYYQ